MLTRLFNKLKKYNIRTLSTRHINLKKYIDMCRHCRGFGFIVLDEKLVECIMCGGTGHGYRIY